MNQLVPGTKRIASNMASSFDYMGIPTLSFTISIDKHFRPHGKIGRSLDREDVLIDIEMNTLATIVWQDCQVS